MTPVPPVKTPVSDALAPNVMEVGLAVKLVMLGTTGGGVVVLLDEPPQPVSPPKHRLSAMAHATEARIRFIRIPRLQHI